MTNAPRRAVDVAVVGGGPAGAAMAIRLARRGLSVVVLERSPGWRWRACGVFASPAAVAELRALGLSGQTIDRVARAVPAMSVETSRGTVFRLEYRGPGEGAADAVGPAGAVGFDREALDAALLELASSAGAEVLRGHAVETLAVSPGRREGELTVRSAGGATRIRAHVIVGADGIRSVVARQVGAARSVRLGRRVGLTWHIPDPAGDAIHDARMIVLDGAYCGLAPVPGGRLNVGIVLSGRDRLRALASRGAAAIGAAILEEALARDLGSRVHRAPAPIERVAGAMPLGHRVSRRAGRGWLLIGDAAGFLDPFTGEGLHRAFVSARLAADALTEGSTIPTDLSAYDRAMRQRFGSKDQVSLVVQAFLSQPRLFEYAARRLAGRERSRETLGMVMADLIPARRALDPAFLAALLAP